MEVLIVSRKILCEACGSILNEDILRQKNSLNTCLVCGASLGMDETENESESAQEELVDWLYIEFDDSNTYFIIEKSKAKLENMTSDMKIKHTFKAPPEGEDEDCEAAKEVLRREYKPDAFLESEECTITKPDALWASEGKCPRCHSSNLQLVPRKFSIWTGFRTNKVDRMCVNCGYRF